VGRGPVLSVGARVCALGFVLVSLVHLGALVADQGTLADVSQALLMPALAAFVATATRWPRGHLVRWSVVALGASWLGDSLPALLADDTAFLVMVGCFLVAQVAYIVAFAPDASRSVLRRRPLALLGYGAVLVGLLALCAPHAGTMLVPVAVYGGCLIAMAVLSTGVSALAGVGGAVFVVSDSLIALDHFVPGWHLPGQDVWVMVTYLVGQALIAVAVVQRNRAVRAPRPATAAPARPAATTPHNVVSMTRA
jgi:uncharacterized membrane protein YhhN